MIETWTLMIIIYSAGVPTPKVHEIVKSSEICYEKLHELKENGLNGYCTPNKK